MALLILAESTMVLLLMMRSDRLMAENKLTSIILCLRVCWPGMWGWGWGMQRRAQRAEECWEHYCCCEKYGS